MKHRLAKFTMPRQRGVTTRHRLFDLLSAARDLPAVWIAGAPGAGKTTLAASYAHAAQVPCSWFQVDAGDNDLAELFGSFDMAAGEPSARRQRLPVFAAEHTPNLQVFARRFFRALYARLPAPCVVVLDNLHELESGPPLEVLRVAVEELPAGIQMLLLSRTAPPPEFAALEAARKLERLEAQALAFTRDELQALLPKHDALSVASIHDLTQGWSAGIVLAARCWPAGGASPGTPGVDDERAESKEAIFRFFAHEVLSKMPAHEQRFLQVVSLLPEMSVERAEALTGEAQSGRILEAAYRRNLFTTYRRGLPGVYQFHALFREYLLGQAERLITAAEFGAARREAAGLLLGAGEVAQALDLLVDAREWKLAREALVGSARSLLRQGRYATLRHWIEALPAEVLEADAWLLYWMGQACAREDEMVGCEWYERAYVRFEASEDNGLGLVLCASAALLAIHVADVTFKDLVLWSGRLRKALPASPRQLLPVDNLALTIALVAASMLGVPALPEQETLTSVERILTLIEADSSAVDAEIVTAACAVLRYCHEEREHALFMRARQLIEPRLRRPHVSPLERGRWMLQMAHCYFVFSLFPGGGKMLDLARTTMHEVSAIVEQEQVAALEFVLVLFETDVAIADGDEERFADRIAYADARVGARGPVALQEYGESLCGLHLIRGEIAEALSAAAKAQQGARRAMTPMVNCQGLRVVHGQALIAARREDEAIALFEDVIADLEGRQVVVGSAFVAFARAWHLRRQGLCHLASLRQGLRLAIESGWVYFMVHSPGIVARLCADALAHDIEPEFVRECIERRRLVPPADAGESWPWRVRVQVLGTFHLQVSGNDAPLGAKTPRRQVELLQAIALSGAAGLSTWQATDWLWPDGESSKNSLDVTLHRLRKLLGDANAVQIRDGLLVFDRSLVWSDVVQFDATAASLLDADLGALSDAQVQAQSARVLALYRGPLLAGSPESAWVLGAREQFHARFERIVQALGGQLERRALWGAALELYARALAHDSLAEAFYRGQIRCHIALAQPAEALSAFRRCRHLLSVVLGVAPAAQTLALVSKLREQA